MAAAALTTRTEKMPMRKVQMEERRKHHHFLVWRHSTWSPITWSPITGPIAPVSPTTASPTESVLMLRPGLTPSSSHLVEWLLKDCEDLDIQLLLHQWMRALHACIPSSLTCQIADCQPISACIVYRENSIVMADWSITEDTDTDWTFHTALRWDLLGTQSVIFSILATEQEGFCCYWWGPSVWWQNIASELRKLGAPLQHWYTIPFIMRVSTQVLIKCW